MKRVLFLLPILLFIAACTDNLPSNIPYFQSSSGTISEPLIVNFLQNQPPAELYEDGSFRVGLKLTSYSLKELKPSVCISDPLGDYFSGIPSNACSLVQLAKAEKVSGNIIPDTQEVYFPSISGNYNYKHVTPGLTSTIIAETYFPYQTIANTQICLKKDINVETPGVPCDLSSNEKVIQDPAPIIISDIKKDVIPKGDGKITLYLSFTIQNSGSGKVLDPLKVSPFDKDTTDGPYIDLNIKVKGTTTSFNCPPNKNKRILLKENQKAIKCEGFMNINQEYVIVPVEITLNYGYKTITSTGSIRLIGKEEV